MEKQYRKNSRDSMNGAMSFVSMVLALRRYAHDTRCELKADFLRPQVRSVNQDQ